MVIFAKQWKKIKERKKYIMIGVGVLLINYFADKLTKYLALVFLKGNKPISYFGDLVILTFAENEGAFLGIGSDWNIYVKYVVLLVIPTVILLSMLFYLLLKEKDMKKLVLGSCVVGGGMGNLIDRLCNNFKAIDFLNFGVSNVRTGILNVADLSITFGVILLLLYEVYIAHKAKGKKE
jgi:signal peptidase II